MELVEVLSPGKLDIDQKQDLTEEIKKTTGCEELPSEVHVFRLRFTEVGVKKGVIL